MNLDRLLTHEEQQRVVRLLRAAGFHRATPMASIRGLVRGAAGLNVRRQKVALEIIECCTEDAA